MATSFKPNKDFFADIVEIDINPKILFEESPEPQNKCKRKYTPFHKKIKSVNNPNSTSNNKENKNLNINQSQTISHTTVETPEITTRYKPVLDKLKTNINSLKDQYHDLIQKSFSKKVQFDSYRMRFLKLKKQEDEKQREKTKKKYLQIKNMKIKQEQEKNQKIKEEIKNNRMNEIMRKRQIVQKLKNKEINDLKKHKIRLIINQNNIKRKKEEEKQFIVNELNLQKSNNLKKIERKKIINQKNALFKAERMQGNKVYNLKQEIKDLESKIKVQNGINNKMNRQYYKYVHKTLNDKVVKGQLESISINPEIICEK